MSNFNPWQCRLDVNFKLCLRIKFTGLPRAHEVINYIKEGNLECRVQDTPRPLFVKKDNKAIVKMLNSKHWKEGEPLDVMKIQLQLMDIFCSDFF